MPAPYPTYHIGDIVKVRTWDSMMEEFGPDPYGDIAVLPGELSFILGMKPFCGKEFVVAKILQTDLTKQPAYFLNYPPHAVSHGNVEDGVYGWSFTSSMLLPTTRSNKFANPTIPTPSVSFDQLLQGVK